MEFGQVIFKDGHCEKVIDYHIISDHNIEFATKSGRYQFIQELDEELSKPLTMEMNGIKVRLPPPYKLPFFRREVVIETSRHPYWFPERERVWDPAYDIERLVLATDRCRCDKYGIWSSD